MLSKHKGLSEAEAVERLAKYGTNEIKELSHVSWPRILFRQVSKNFIVYLLFAAALLSVLVGKSLTATVIAFVIAIVVFVGFAQEYKAEKAVKELKKIISPVSIVIRDGRETEVLSSRIVPGDIIVLRTGEKVPADCAILEEKELRLNEAVLTGESKEIAKGIAKSTQNPEDSGKVFAGTLITGGRCIALAVHTGMNTEFGKIAGLISKAEKEMPLQGKINYIIKYMIAVALTMAFLTGIVLLLRSPDITSELMVEVAVVAIAIAVSALPEGFPVVLITTLSIGTFRMARKNAIVNRMSIIETLGETTVICSDKTGTITKGEMTVKEAFVQDSFFKISGVGFEAEGKFFEDSQERSPLSHEGLRIMLEAGVLCSDARIERTGEDSYYKLTGSPTEGALMIMAAKAGVFREDLNAERLEEIPFSSESKMMSVLCENEGGKIVFTKGAPEVILEKCTEFFGKKGILKLSESEKNRILKAQSEFHAKKYRVIALAFRNNVKSSSIKELEKDLVFLGLAAMEDPPREEVKAAVGACMDAGISVKMITGDNKETAIEIAKEVGIFGRAVSVEELDAMTDDELAKNVSEIAIFSRVRPEHKMRIIKALKANGETVTMTGDGVNDAPALKEAHIGVAMGKAGTDVSREASDIIIKDDNFATIVSAIEEGRTIFSNIRKFVAYQLSCNLAELATVFIAVSIGLPLPLLALQILFMNLVTDDLPALTLGLNPGSRNAMHEKPRKGSKILTRQFVMLMIFSATVMAAGTLAVFHLELNVLGQSIESSRTAALVTLILMEVCVAFNFRSFRHYFHKSPLNSNRHLLLASAGSVAATLAIIYTPLNQAFGTVFLSATQWIVPLAFAAFSIVIFDVFKMVNNKKRILPELLQ